MSKKTDKVPPTDKRTRIVEKAIECVHSQGLHPINLSLVAREMKLSQPLVFYYFPEQNSLFEAMLVHIVTTNRNLVARHLQKTQLNHRKSLVTYINGNLQWARRYPEQVGTLLSFMIPRRSKSETQLKVAKALLAGQETIYGFLTGGIAEKEFSVKTPPRMCSQLIHQALMGAIIMGYVVQEKEEKNAAHSYLIQLIDGLLLRPRTEKRSL
jgi:AcrR family transcriptional regulator